MAMVLMLLVLPVLLVNCTGQTVTAKSAAYKTILSLDVSYDSAFKALGEAYAKGKISEADKTNAIAAGRDFKKYRDAAVEALILGTNYSDWLNKAKGALILVESFLPKKGDK